MSTDKRMSQTTIDAGMVADVEFDEGFNEPPPPHVPDELERATGVRGYLIPPRVRRMLEADLALCRDRMSFDALVDLTGPVFQAGTRQAAGYAARWIAELERANHDLRGLLVEHDKAAELASNEMTAALARNLGPEAITKSRATAAFFHVFDVMREYGHAIGGLTELMALTGNVYTRKALLFHVDSIRLIVDRLKEIPSARLKHVVSVRYTDREGLDVQQQAGPVVENNRLRRQVDQQQIEINRLNQRLAAIGFKPRGKRK